MTPGERLAAGLALSLALHLLVLRAPWGVPGEAGEGAAMVVDLMQTGAGLSQAPPLTLEQEAAEPDPAAADPAAADRRRAVMARYLEDVLRSVHAHRSIVDAGRRLVGNAAFAVTIDAGGRFSDVVLVRSSGEADLDADAARALVHASGTVSRPAILGRGPIRVTLAVKYQFGL